MSYTYDTATDNGKVRLLIQDTTETTAAFSDEEIAIFLSMESNVIRSAAALALEALAADRAKLAKRQRTMNTDKDTRGAAKELREQAASLRASEANAPAYGQAEVNNGELTAIEITSNRITREAS